MGEGVSSGERVRELVRADNLIKEERGSDLNAVGLKTVETGSTGQTGCHDRSDRSELNYPKNC